MGRNRSLSLQSSTMISKYMGVNHKEDRNNLFSLFIADKTRSHGLKLGSGWSSAYGPWGKLSWQAGETAVKTILRSCLLCPSPSYSSELWERLSCDKWYHYLSAVNVNLVGVSVKNDAIWLQCSTLTQNVYVPNTYFGNYNENYQDKKLQCEKPGGWKAIRIFPIWKKIIT